MTLALFNPLPPKGPAVLSRAKYTPNIYDLVAFLLVIATFALIAIGIDGMHQTLIKLQATPIELSLAKLPKYALFTTLRMFAAIIASLIFTFLIATLAAKNRKAEMIIIPTLDVLQSVPILGFLTFTVTFFIQLFPEYQLGVELAAIFAIFTSQAWNMTFSFYQSLRNIPQDLREASQQFCLNRRQTYWRLEVPFAMPGLVWNTMMSMSGGWFFVVASEAISIGNTQVKLPGIGSWLSVAITEKNFSAVAWAVIAMGIVILIYDQLLFRPIVAWADKFSMGLTASQQQAKSWVYNVLRRSNILSMLMRPFGKLVRWLLSYQIPKVLVQNLALPGRLIVKSKIFDCLWFIALYTTIIIITAFILHYLNKTITLNMLSDVLVLASFTTMRVAILIMIASIVWVPIGVWVGLRPNMVAWAQPMAQFLAAFPANILFPIFVIAIMHYQLNPDIWLSPLMILGTQWYIFFNVIAGASAFPNDIKEAAQVYKLPNWLWWRKIILPGIFPYYITGALTAAGGAWNASIIAEVASWGTDKIEARGLGSYITAATNAGDFHKVVLGITIMSLCVVILNHVCWQRLYNYATRHTGFN